MRRILAATTALALSLSVPAFAQMDQFTYTPTGEEIEASGFIGARVYTSETDVNDDMSWTDWDGSREDWNDIGEVNDVLMDDSGNIKAVLVDVGGFLGIGEKQVAMNMDALRLQSDGEAADEYFVVVNSSREALEDAPEFEGRDHAGLDRMERHDEVATGAGETMSMSVANSDEAINGTAETPIVSNEANSAAPAEGENALASWGVDGNDDGWSAADSDAMTAENLTGARVYDAEDNWVGEIDRLELAADGEIDEAIIDVGGFLGIGEKPVAVDFEQLDIRQASNGDTLRVYVDATKDSLQEMPEYQG